MAKFNELKYTLFEHSPYLLDLATSDLYMFRNLEQFLRGKHFSSNEEAITAVEAYFAVLSESYFRDGIQLLECHILIKSFLELCIVFFHFCSANFSRHLYTYVSAERTLSELLHIKTEKRNKLNVNMVENVTCMYMYNAKALVNRKNRCWDPKDSRLALLFLLNSLTFNIE